MLGAIGGATLCLLYLLDPPLTAPTSGPQISTATLFTALALALAGAVGFLLAPEAPWWTAVTTALLGGPLLLTCSAAVHRAVQHLLRRTAWEADLACTAGVLHAAVLLLAAHAQGMSITATLAVSAASWPVAALLTAALTSRRGCGIEQSSAEATARAPAPAATPRPAP
ncbi:hypothetical protein [Streptomyces aurantiogriseus]|uniref:Uncharacterized protein n=1 Tax=Streptomyces aurantiogriseus TaxID=66870 RepID=A0A918FPM5_9ACTN|nr:hypothetical protein [Streptomyces aurantiogriseus]GGR64095.1 hypothetical protein GCM10010251_95900 [Streptomyces aurantiogriseus]